MAHYQHQNTHKSLTHPDNRRQQNPVLAQIPRIFSDIPFIALLLHQDRYLLKIGSIQFSPAKTYVCNNYIFIINESNQRAVFSSKNNCHFTAHIQMAKSLELQCLQTAFWNWLGQCCPLNCAQQWSVQTSVLPR